MSIKKIAEMTGLSYSTVSRVLNNPDYKCSTKGLREKIWKAAMELESKLIKRDSCTLANESKWCDYYI